MRLALRLIAALGLAAALFVLLYPPGPPGRMVDVGGFRLHLVCEGEGSPAVILEAGAADAWLTWHQIQPELGRLTRVCSYDRAGIGYSDPGPRPRSRRRAVEELRTLLARAGVPPPYVLVGHSFGGSSARLHALLHPEEVAGLVLVESSHEDHWLRAPREFRQRNLDRMNEERLEAEKAERGEAMPAILAIPGLSWWERRQLSAVNRRPAWYLASFEESQMSEASRAEFAGLPRTLDLPLVVLSAGRRVRPEWRSLELHERWVRIAAELQADLASRSTRSRHVVVPDAGHSLHWDRPDVVVEEVREVVREARQ
jgi:pimeloyl-ACP methyl ester carboxylesterase